jgi:hypothetical protein
VSTKTFDTKFRILTVILLNNHKHTITHTGTYKNHINLVIPAGYEKIHSSSNHKISYEKKNSTTNEKRKVNLKFEDL